MAEIRVAKPARRGRMWLWLIPLALLLAGGAYFLNDRAGDPTPQAAADTTGAAAGGAIDTVGTTPLAPSPATVGDTAPGAPSTEPAAEASKNGAAGVAAPGPGPR